MNHPRKQPDFQKLLNVLARRPTEKPVLFDFFMGDEHERRLAGDAWRPGDEPFTRLQNAIAANMVAGYDYTWLPPWIFKFGFPTIQREHVQSVGMAESGVIGDWASFEAYQWLNPEDDDLGLIDQIKPHLPDGMKLIVFSPGGVLENLISLVGFEPLCMLLADDPDLVQAIVDAIGSRLLRFYQLVLQHDAIGAAVVNDDWGFKTQPFLAPAQMRELIIPWHRRMVETIHATGRPAMLHSCGELKLLWEDIIEDLKFDGKHSYEDTILPVEEAYEKYGSRIAILGGIDMDYLCRSTPDEVYRRSKAMIERTQARGGYGLGTGNSVPNFIPAASFDAMRRAAE